MQTSRSDRDTVGSALAVAADAATMLAEVLSTIQDPDGSSTRATGTEAGAWPFIAALQQLGAAGAILAEQLMNLDRDATFDGSVAEWISTAGLAIDLLKAAWK